MKNRREFLAQFTMAAAAVTFFKPLQVFAGSNKENLPGSYNTLSILHTSNLKGQLSSLSKNEKLYGLGGLNNLAKKIRTIREENSSLLLIDSGNIYSGKVHSEEAQLEFYNIFSKLKYDAVIPGKTDLTLGSEVFNELAHKSNLKLVPHEDSFITGNLLPYKIIHKKNIEIAIIDAGANSLLKKGKFTDSACISAINKTAEKIKDQNECRFIVCIIQEEFLKCIKYISGSSNIDVVISSMDKTSVYNSRIVRNKFDQEVLLSHAGTKGTMMGSINITFNECFEKINVKSQAIFVGAEDMEISFLLKKYGLFEV
jgi:5'-nucleotidase